MDHLVFVRYLYQHHACNRSVTQKIVEGYWPMQKVQNSSNTQGRDQSSASSILRLPPQSLSTQETHAGYGLLSCPHCWHAFKPEDLLFISPHPGLRGDPVLGDDAYRRFSPTRFRPNGQAVDSEGTLCNNVACPRCHLGIPRAYILMPPLFLSIIGAPGSGKSYFLAGMCWKMKSTFSSMFHVNVVDMDGAMNRWIVEYIEKLFTPVDPKEYVLLVRTQAAEGHTQRVNIDNYAMTLTVPCIFQLQAVESAACRSASGDINRALVMYDNAGEDFLPDSDHPSIQHLARAECLFFLFDPTKDARFRAALVNSQDVQVRAQKTVHSQDVILAEMINRIRTALAMNPKDRCAKPSVIIITKADVLTELMTDELRELTTRDPWVMDKSRRCHALDLDVLLRVSFATRQLLQRYAPEMVATAEAMLSDVIYVPVSALGHSPSTTDKDTLVVQPCKVKPNWVDVPLAYLLHRLRFIAGIKRRDESHPLPTSYELRRGKFLFAVPGSTEQVSLPVSYAGVSLQSPANRSWFRVPDVPAPSKDGRKD